MFNLKDCEICKRSSVPISKELVSKTCLKSEPFYDFPKCSEENCKNQITNLIATWPERLVLGHLNEVEYSSSFKLVLKEIEKSSNVSQKDRYYIQTKSMIRVHPEKLSVDCEEDYVEFDIPIVTRIDVPKEGALSSSVKAKLLKSKKDKSAPPEPVDAPKKDKITLTGSIELDMGKVVLDKLPTKYTKLRKITEWMMNVNNYNIKVAFRAMDGMKKTECNIECEDLNMCEHKFREIYQYLKGAYMHQNEVHEKITPIPACDCLASPCFDTRFNITNLRVPDSEECRRCKTDGLIRYVGLKNLAELDDLDIVAVFPELKIDPTMFQNKTGSKEVTKDAELNDSLFQNLV